MNWPHHQAEDANGHPSLPVMLAEVRTDIKWIIHGLDGLTSQVMEMRTQLGHGRSRMDRHESEIGALRDKVQADAKAQAALKPSRVEALLAFLREIMSIKEWIGGGVFVACSLLGIKMPAEVKAYVLWLAGLAGSGP